MLIMVFQLHVQLMASLNGSQLFNDPPVKVEELISKKYMSEELNSCTNNAFIWIIWAEWGI